MYKLMLSFLTLIVLLFSGCGGGGGSSSSTSTAGAGGAGAKGPFVLGSTVMAYQLENNGSRTATDVNTTTTDNLGHYSLSGITWSGATELEISGKYFNENNGTISTTPATLSAIVNVASGQTINANINVLTDLAAQRTKALMLAGQALATAKAQAKSAVVQLFDINLSAGANLEDLDLTKGSGTNVKANADLLRISAAISAHPTVLSQLKEAIEDGNVTNDANGSVAFATLAQAVNDVNLTQVSDNLVQNLSITNPPDANDTDDNASFASNAHAPVIVPIASQNKNEDDGAFDITLSATDGDGDSVTFINAVSSDTSKATVSLSGTTLTITPQANANGNVVITVTASDGELIDTETFNLVLAPQNDAPTMSSTISNITKDEDSPAFTVDLNATDIDGDSITYDANSSDTSKATVSVSGSILTITPQANANGVVTINVSANDGHGGVDTKSFTLNLTAVNDAPILANSTGIVAEDANVGTIVGHVTIVNSGDAPISSFSLNGTGANNFDINNSGYVTVKTGNSLDYETTTEYNLTVTANNSDDSNTVSMDITVTDVPDVAPVLNTTALNVDENKTGTVGNILSDNGDRPISSCTIISGNDGNFNVSNDGTLSVVGALDYETTQSYTLELNATSDSGSTTGTITVNVNNIIDTPPTLAPFVGSINENATITDIVGDINITNPGDGTITGFVLSDSNFAGDANAKIITAGSLDYETNPVYNFTMYATSDAGNSNTVDVNITIYDINDAPVADDANFTTQQDTNLSINMQPYVHEEDENQDITGTFSNPSHGTITDNGEGHLIYTPNSGYTGTDSFTYSVEDNGTNPGPLTSNTATVHITITAANAPSSGTATDPHIVGAQFWADVNGNGVKDANETSTLSDINGSFSFQIFVPDDTNVTMIKQGLHNGKPFDGNISAKFEASRNGIISPITTLGTKGFSDSELVSIFTNAGLNGITESELYLDPFDTSLLPLDGNMSSYPDANISKFSRVLIANVALNAVLTMGNGYGMSKNDINNSFFSNGALGLMVGAGKSVLTLNALKNTHARVMARIFVNVATYVRDKMIADSSYDYTTDSSLQPMIDTLISAYTQALQYGLTDPKFGWVEDDGTYAPMLFIQPNELGNHDVTIVYDDNNNDANVTFASSGHSFTNSSGISGNWQVVDGNLTASDGGSNNFQFNLLGDKIKINGVAHDVLEVIYNGDNFSSSNTFSGAANPGDFANFAVNGSQLDYNISGTVFGSQSGSLTLQDVTGHGVFFYV